MHDILYVLKILLAIGVGSALGISSAYCCCKLSHIWNRKEPPDYINIHIQMVKDQKDQFEKFLEYLKIHRLDNDTEDQ